MKIHRFGVIAALLTAFTLALSACSTVQSPDVTTTTTPPPAAPADQLNAALAKLKGASYDVQLSQQGATISAHGSVDGPSAA